MNSAMTATRSAQRTKVFEEQKLAQLSVSTSGQCAFQIEPSLNVTAGDKSDHWIADVNMAQPPKVGQTADLATLTSLDNDVLLNELHVRYDQDSIYVCLQLRGVTWVISTRHCFRHTLATS
jgi:myosin heavy subunit